MAARIFQRSKNAMQSGRARTDQWVLQFESARAKRADPLTGWSGGAETQEQVRLTFPSLEAAKAYADREGIDAHIVPNTPIISAARTVLPPSNCSMSFGNTGMIIPSASMSSRTVKKMNVTAAREGAAGGGESITAASNHPSFFAGR